MRPALKPGLMQVWRNRDTVQIGIDPRRAIALTGMRGAAGLLGLLDGSREHSQVLAEAHELGIGAGVADRVLTLLAAGGVLHDFPVGTYRAMPSGLRARLASELAAAALAHGHDDGGARTLARRQAAQVRVHGRSPLSTHIAALLSGAGIGQVISTGLTATAPPPPAQPNSGQPDTGQPSTGQPSTGQPSTGQPSTGQPAAQPSAGQPSAALARAVAGTGPHGRPGAAGPGRRPDLVILADCHRRDLAAGLSRALVPHLGAFAGEAIGVVGPLVRPGLSACVRCLDLARAERDPAWPVILAQLGQRSADPPACGAVLAAAVAAQATAQALAFVDRACPVAAVTNGTIELVLPGWQWRRRSWQPHDRCDCGAYRPR